ncbi:hypothetical protein C8A00DRAFT_15835 [Chaetomidium leptoderma]|uniref:F-box domain-containing protein n=1 Tax=Chaetomidium leptoderma TaxID=669021 RepID=A0AAN6VJW2_9PEZI|nr:hypothetical protein C8A00DRAFT_15835 [Chaetomidium leptoderma]
MAVFVDLDEEDNDPRQDGQPLWNGLVDAVKPAPGTAASSSLPGDSSISGTSNAADKQREKAHGLAVGENLNWIPMAQALGCYPCTLPREDITDRMASIIMLVVSSIDLNTLDSLARTCRQVRAALLQYRKMLLLSTLHCVNEDLPVDPEETMRYRARAGNWYYMQDAARSSDKGKAGQCARDMVAGCRRCGTVVCRNCAIKPPAPIVLRDRHRRLCQACVTAPVGSLVKPPLGPEIRIDSDDMERAICKCGSEGVWLCQPCGRSILGDDSEYKGIWKWRNQYTEVLGGLGTGIGEGDRGVICGRETECCAAREREQDVDGDAEDAREAEEFFYHQQSATTSPLSNATTTPSLAPWTTLSGPGSTASLSSLVSSSAAGGGGGGGDGASILDRRTPSPALKPGYERHEIEGIGGVMKKMRVRMVKVGACVPEWEDERAKGEILGREVQGRRRGWCGWCRRVVPSREDYDMDRQFRDKGKGKERETEGARS